MDRKVYLAFLDKGYFLSHTPGSFIDAFLRKMFHDDTFWQSGWGLDYKKSLFVSVASNVDYMINHRKLLIAFCGINLAISHVQAKHLSTTLYQLAEHIFYTHIRQIFIFGASQLKKLHNG